MNDDHKETLHAIRIRLGTAERLVDRFVIRTTRDEYSNAIRDLGEAINELVHAVDRLTGIVESKEP